MRGDLRGRVRALLDRHGVTRAELAVLAGLVVLGLVVRVTFVLVTKDHALQGDEIDWNTYGVLASDGRWFWTDKLSGLPHPSMWKPPVYPLFLGISYNVLGTDPDRTLLLQSVLFGPVTLVLVWLLGRRLVGPRTGLAAAAIWAVYPFAWQWETRLYSEVLAVPLVLAVLLLVLARPVPRPRGAALIGLLVGLNLLVRPTSAFLFVLVLAAWVLAAGWRTGIARSAVVVAAAVLVVAPWTFRNTQIEGGGFVPISVQDAAVYGTFNEDAAHDRDRPWAWRPGPPSLNRFLTIEAPTFTEAEFRERATELARDYVSDHPSAVLHAIWWNGIRRLWDLRGTKEPLEEVRFQGREARPTRVGLYMYWVMLPLALVALVVLRRRRELWVPLLATAAAAAVIFSIDSGTRYRAPFEPLVVVLACAAIPALRRPDAFRGRGT